MEKFQQTINHAEIKRNAIAKAKEVAGKDINKAIRLAKKFYTQMIHKAMCPIINCKELQNVA